jgi:hypothetical protein
MDWLKKRLIDPLLNLLRQGLSPKDLALCVALGSGVGLFPVLGVSTPALTVLALTLRLNLAAIQLVSYAIAPLQLALIIPFMRLGEIVLGSTPQPMTISADPRCALRDRDAVGRHHPCGSGVVFDRSYFDFRLIQDSGADLCSFIENLEL